MRSLRYASAALGLICCLALASLPAIASAAVSYAKDPWNINIDTPVLPSVILSIGMLKDKKPHPDERGDPHGLIGIKITPNVSNAHIVVTAQVDGLSKPSQYDGTLGKAGKTYTVRPTMRWNTEQLLHLYQPLPETVTISVTLNGVNLGSKTKSVEIHSVNDVPFEVKTSNGKWVDSSVLYAAYVNENSPVVEKILQQALYYRAVKSFDGYQRNQANVEMQVFAVWNVLQRRHIHYSSVATPSVHSDQAYTQTVRFIGQAWGSQQANCVDGSVLFASVLYKIGLQPLLIRTPDHMFLGYYVKPRTSTAPGKLEFLETTLVGQGPLPSKLTWRFGHFIYPPKSSKSYREFVQAVKYGDKEFYSEVLPALKAHKPGYDIIDVAKARQIGINAISN